jgi:hypothetical protein
MRLATICKKFHQDRFSITEMARRASEEYRKRIIHYHENVAMGVKKKTVSHFEEEGKNPKSIYNILARFEATGEVDFKPIPGRPSVVMSPENIVKVEKTFSKQPCISTRSAARKLGMAQSTLMKIKLKKLGIKGYVKKKVPKYSGDQETRAKTGARHVYKKSLEKTMIIDDESYFPFDPSDVPGKKYYHAKTIGEPKYEDRIKPVTKFPKRHMVWLAMNEMVKFHNLFILWAL